MSEISDEERNPIEAPEGRRFRPDSSAASGWSPDRKRARPDGHAGATHGSRFVTAMMRAAIASWA
jgi:hypothetical protein